MRRKLPRVQPGEILRAEHLNVLYEELERLGLTVAGNLVLSTGRGGMTLAATCPQQFWAKITGAAVDLPLSVGTIVYPWIEMIPQEGGTWVEGTDSGTTHLTGGGAPDGDPAVESNGNDEVPEGTIVRAYRELGVLGFTFRECE